jgi:hypothetical protein
MAGRRLGALTADRDRRARTLSISWP